MASEPPSIRPGLVQRWRGRALAFVAGGVAAAALAGAAGMAVAEFGLYNTASTAPHPAPVSWALHTTFKHSVRLRSRDIKAPDHFTAEQVRAGFQQYRTDCEACHGGPGVSRAPWVRGLTPTPPFLLDTAYRFTPAQLDWILRNGVKMSAMPAWSETRSPAQIWAVVAFLEALPNISPAQYAQMKSSLPSGAASVVPAPPAKAKPDR